MTGGDPTDGLAASRSMAHGAQLARNARKAPGKVALRCGDHEVTYGKLDQRVTRLAHALADRGVAFGDRVAMVMTNRIEVVESYLAACRLGAIAVPVNFRLVAEEVVYIVSDAGARVLLVDDGLAALGAEVVDRVD